MIFHRSVQAQGSQTLSTHTYDTSLNSNGFGYYSITVPQWSPDSGTLVSVKLAATVSSQYGFTLSNADAANATYSLTLGQDDQITGTALSSMYSNVTSQFVNSYPLASGQSVTQTPFSFLTNHVSSDSITANTTPFLGFGKVTLNYLSFTYTDLSTADNATYYYSASINNTIKFAVTYTYLSGGSTILATDLTRFSAELTSPHVATETWAATNETAGRVYDVQRSRDGVNFTTLTSMAAQGNASGADYSYADNLPDSVSGNLLYRLQIHDQGNLSFSPIQQVSVAASTTAMAPGLQLFPNPAVNGINLRTGVDADDWQVDILAANGALVQRTTVLQSSVMYIPFSNKLAVGTYFVRLTGLHGQKGFTASFVVL